MSSFFPAVPGTPDRELMVRSSDNAAMGPTGDARVAHFSHAVPEARGCWTVTDVSIPRQALPRATENLARGEQRMGS